MREHSTVTFLNIYFLPWCTQDGCHAHHRPPAVPLATYSLIERHSMHVPKREHREEVEEI